LTFVFSESNAETLKNVRSRLVPIINGLWANPPLHGAKIVEEVLRNGELRNEWLETLKARTDLLFFNITKLMNNTFLLIHHIHFQKMSERLKGIRLELRAALEKQNHEVMDKKEEGGGNSLSHSSSWANLTEQTGFFSYTGLTGSKFI
jgi:aspartate/tyrosine/aromatic aminotransferase